MHKRKFAVGDRVIGTGIVDDLDITDMTGTVVDMDGARYGVAFDERNVNFHWLGGRLEDDSGWWCDEFALAHYEEPREYGDVPDVMDLL